MAPGIDQARYIVGLTGGIGSGKSTVANMFAALGVELVDADLISRQLVQAGSPALTQIRHHFGPAVLTPDGELDRPALRRLIFEDRTHKLWLEQLLHPRVREEVSRRTAAAASDYVLLVIPLLLESGQYEEVDRVLVVDAPEALQLERTMARDNSSRAEVEKVMATQLPRRERLEGADDIIDNSGSPEHARTEVEKLHEFYRQQAARRHQAG